MSAVILNFADYAAQRNEGTIAERVAKRLPGVAQCVLRYAQVFAESMARNRGYTDDDAVEAGVRCAKNQPDPSGPRAA